MTHFCTLEIMASVICRGHIGSLNDVQHTQSGIEKYSSFALEQTRGILTPAPPFSGVCYMRFCSAREEIVRGFMLTL